MTDSGGHARSEDGTRSRIVEAATQLLREGGAQAVTTRAVAQAAGAQAPSIYRFFGDKDGLVNAVAEHVMEQWVTQKAAAVPGEDADPMAALRSGWESQIEFGLANPELYALLNAPERSRRSPATAAGIEILQARIRRLAQTGVLRVSELRALEMVHAGGTGAVLTLLATPPEHRDPGLAGALFEAVIAAICLTTPGRTDTGVLATAVSFAAVVPELPGLRPPERALLTDWVEQSIATLENGAEERPD